MRAAVASEHAGSFHTGLLVNQFSPEMQENQSNYLVFIFDTHD